MKDLFTSDTFHKHCRNSIMRGKAIAIYKVRFDAYCFFCHGLAPACHLVHNSK